MSAPVPNFRRMGLAKCDLGDAVRKIADEYELSTAEVFSILAQEMSSLANSCVCTEREEADKKPKPV